MATASCDAERCTKRFGEEAHVIEPGEAGEATHRIVREHVVYGVVQAAEEVRECRSVRWFGVRTPRVPVVRIVWVLQVSGAVQVVLLRELTAIAGGLGGLLAVRKPCACVPEAWKTATRPTAGIKGAARTSGHPSVWQVDGTKRLATIPVVDLGRINQRREASHGVAPTSP